LWRELRAHRFAGAKFRRQTPIDSFIADFCSFDAHLIVEVDGGQHDIRRWQDDQRTAYLNGQGFNVIRFWNNEVLSNLDGVLWRIEQALRNPSP
jgi:very-short-patch-repair endonuclease